ncbi:MAG: hypothetical protein K0R29_2793 [Pseudobdellovibrio sp.]|nr:hypothetical protein [Pseudobdellovibrio sp.]
MAKIKKPGKSFFIFAPLALRLRRLNEALSVGSDFKRDGFQFFENGTFLKPELAHAKIKEINSILDQIEDSRLKNTESAKASGEAEHYSYEFINENTFYQEKLGYRLRVSYNINQFENWPKLAQDIINSEKYKTFLKTTYGTVNGVHKCYIEKTFLGGPEPQWHVDCLANMARLVYLLSDVDSNAAPLEFIKSSQLDSNRQFTEIKMRHLKSAESWTPYTHLGSGSEVKQFTGTTGSSYMFLELNRGGWPAGTRSLP